VLQLAGGEVAARVVHQLRQHAERQRPQLGLAQAPAARQRLFAQQALQHAHAAGRALCAARGAGPLAAVSAPPDQQASAYARPLGGLP